MKNKALTHRHHCNSFMCYIIGIVSLLYTNAFYQKHVPLYISKAETNPRSKQFSTSIHLKPNSNSGNSEGKKFRIITPNDIGKIFEYNSSSSRSNRGAIEDDTSDDNDFDFEDDNESIRTLSDEEDGAEFTFIKGTEKKSAQPEQDIEADFALINPISNIENNAKDSQIITELEALYSMSGLSNFVDEITVKETKKEGNEDATMENEEDEFGYGDLGRKLDKSTYRKVKESMTVTTSLSSPTTDANSLRTFRYDPTLLKRGDPMLYGAYRRWKEVTVEASSTGTKKSQKGGLSGGKGKKKSKNAADKFYDAIKKLGSGPAEKGSSSQTGIAEPPPNSKPIQPKKAPGKKAKKIITPDDIDSLFKKPPPPTSTSTTDNNNNSNNNSSDDDDDESDDDDISDDEEDDDDVEEDKMARNGQKVMNNAGTGMSNYNSNGNVVSNFNSMIGTDDNVPQWLTDADKEAKKKKAAKKGKQKKLTDDWRFWVAIIAGAGFASAFYSMYQQTGGFGYVNPFTMNGGVSLDGSNGGEMVI